MWREESNGGCGWLIIINGVYKQRLADIANTLNIKLVDLSYPENRQPKLNDIEQSILIDENITHIAMVHCKTSTGMINPVEAVVAIARKYIELPSTTTHQLITKRRETI